MLHTAQDLTKTFLVRRAAAFLRYFPISPKKMPNLSRSSSCLLTTGKFSVTDIVRPIGERSTAGCKTGREVYLIVLSGKDCEDFQKGKSFLSIPFDSPVRQVLLEKLTVRSFPTLIVCNIKTGKILTRWGRLAVMYVPDTCTYELVFLMSIRV